MKSKFLPVIIILTFVACNIEHFSNWIFNIGFWSELFGKETWEHMRLSLRLTIVHSYQFLVVFLVLKYLLKYSPFEALGLNRGFVKGFYISLACTLPMFIGYFWISHTVQPDFTFDIAFRDIVSAGFFEEFMFRGFLFGMLFLYAGWGFIPATILTSVLFGAGHLYQANDIGTAISVFMVTALGSAGFSLFYLGWRSLWMPIFMHTFMDLSWDMFGNFENAAGSTYANVFRILSIVLAVTVTVIKARKENNTLIKGKLWTNHLKSAYV